MDRSRPETATRTVRVVARALSFAILLLEVLVIAGFAGSAAGAGPGMGRTVAGGSAADGSAVDGPVAGGPAGPAAGGVAGGHRSAGSGASAGRPGRDLPVFRSVRTFREIAPPVRLRIPSVGVDAPVEPVGLAPDGSIAAPDGWQVAGWYRGGPRPGQGGGAVVVGHVDSRSGPAVFFRLALARPGDPVFVDRADGTSARFRVTGRLQVAKDRFPADLYSPTLQPALLLVTCGGPFDAATGHYRDNVVVSALPG
ncbi:MAG TPA: sortase [Kineosporiaceae bacterium]|nr:sortase [Kineosporiaceae bacterium]